MVGGGGLSVPPARLGKSPISWQPDQIRFFSRYGSETVIRFLKKTIHIMISRPNGKLFKRSTKKGEKSENGEREVK